MKTCCTCKSTKSNDQFHKNKSSNDGLYKVCKDCRKVSSKEYRDRFGDQIRAKWRENYKLNPEKHRATSIKYQKENWDSRKAYMRSWTKKNKIKANIYTAKRYSALRQATPPWLTKEQKAEIKWFYDTAKEIQWLAEEPLTVDHIEPLRGDISSGLHVPWNLQIISKSENSRKGNKLRS